MRGNAFCTMYFVCIYWCICFVLAMMAMMMITTMKNHHYNGDDVVDNYISILLINSMSDIVHQIIENKLVTQSLPTENTKQHSNFYECMSKCGNSSNEQFIYHSLFHSISLIDYLWCIRMCETNPEHSTIYTITLIWN